MWKKVITALTLIVGLGLFVFFIRKGGGFGKAFEAVAAIGWTGIAVFILNATGTLIFPALGWWILMRSEDMKVSIWTTIKANFMGFPINFIAPSMYLGAEPLKTFYIARVSGETKRKILATIVVSKFQEMGGLLMTMAVAAGIAVWKIKIPLSQEVPVLGALGTLIFLFLLTVRGFVVNAQPTVKFINWIASLSRKKKPFGKWKRRLARLRTRAEEVEFLIHRAFTKRIKTFLVALMVTLGSPISLLMRPWLFFYFSRHHMAIGVEDLSAIIIVTNLINMLPHTPGALGVMEGGMDQLFLLLGLGVQGDAQAFQVVVRVTDVVLILLGAWLIFHYNLQAQAKRVAGGEEKVNLHEAEAGDEEAARPSTSS